ncbi:MAG: hypothetical protein IT424_14135 [Pirellulales bacterium]|nr:hypothetical protein [Pirellulales bacterium]
MAEFFDYQWLVESSDAASLLAELALDTRPALAVIERLRRNLPKERAQLVVEQLDLRRRAAAKFGDFADRMFFTPVHLEQATDRWIARYKAARLASVASGGVVHDYCCGIGGDALALAAAAPCTAYDRSAVASLLAAANVRRIVSEQASFAAQTADVAACAPHADEPWHVDPDRRAGGARTTTLEHFSPSQLVIDRWRARSANGAVKLAPASQVPPSWLAAGEAEWITSRRECRQAVVWFGQLARHAGFRRATIIPAGDGAAGSSFAAIPAAAAEVALAPGRFLFDPDPSLHAAKLIGALANERNLATLGRGGAYLTGDASWRDSLLQIFEVLDCLPMRSHDLAKYLAGRGVGRVEIKKRGVAVDPDRLRQRLKLRGDNEATIVLTRIEQRQIAIVVRRPPRGP